MDDFESKRYQLLEERVKYLEKILNVFYISNDQINDRFEYLIRLIDTRSLQEVFRYIPENNIIAQSVYRLDKDLLDKILSCFSRNRKFEINELIENLRDLTNSIDKTFGIDGYFNRDDYDFEKYCRRKVLETINRLEKQGEIIIGRANEE